MISARQKQNKQIVIANSYHQTQSGTRMVLQ